MSASFSAADATHMARALRLARRGVGATHPNPAVGCVLVRDGQVIGEGFHARAGQPHAEAAALAAAGEAARGAEAFVTLEPCAHHGRTPPCADALIAAGVARVVAAHRDPDPRTAGQGLERLRAAGIDVAEGLMREAARALNRGFIARLERGRPFLTLKLAASLDGRTAMASGESQWITGAAARADVHRQRARHHGILTSAQTVLDDDPQLTARPASGAPTRQPERIVLDARGRVPATARVFTDDGVPRWWLVGEGASVTPPAGVEMLCLPGATPPDPCAVVQQLAAAGFNDVLIECGPRLAGAWLAAGAVDELLLYVAPSLLGDAARPLAALPGLERLADRVQLRWTDVRQLGTDLRITATPVAGQQEG
ncbi:bifunctional diaminohydroxyphosphoribosylaminopyrimidine deaminase/5-amino-6-(5-phosphoribosylamino)uracil reductase RibD [Algiphilus aromaticivorans]|uniref:bifunctional diaminohydroxyphosphoribosylaminopyrimidine deaminase/5-amino-6-(5-phosphoribosylamino)uracil reductase RibD n=1 Tax=Algiphilus aromaticivorans TaxID=382454 RepID=UPI0005C230C5|nr:bifunctional diaminohydroxyphosphoribosylaminopyrimidine deaminase/5-amino-6-(5-phosphoribosylamino)uracil reductase RibD [Algiphilus aromaticivorans]